MPNARHLIFQVADALVVQLPGETARFGASNGIVIEADRGLAGIRAAANRQSAVENVIAVLALTREHAEQFVDALWDDARTDPYFTTRRRTVGSRFVLQSLGSHWRPDGYWAPIWVQMCLDRLDYDENVIFTGGRFRVEHDAFARSGAFMVRLEVTRAEQDRRALARDGYVQADDVFQHPGESALDDAEFDLRIHTDGLTVEQVAQLIVLALEERTTAAA